MITELVLREPHWQDMRAHVEACAPLEACGLLSGWGQVVAEVIPVTNSARSPSRFRMEPREQIRAFQQIDARGQALLGIFHSHPGGASPGMLPPGGPSPTDIAEAAFPVVHVIWTRDQRKWSALGFWIEAGRVSQVPLRITIGE
jgi:proteasome lid subunit RPN8/RPN11